MIMQPFRLYAWRLTCSWHEATAHTVLTVRVPEVTFHCEIESFYSCHLLHFFGCLIHCGIIVSNSLNGGRLTYKHCLVSSQNVNCLI